MRLQRTGVAESPAECSTLNGSLRVRSKEMIVKLFLSIPQRVTSVICEGYDGILQSG